ncbi:MAG: hypothetical protein AAGB19_19970, partial [Cyanobacteria bacterium P01_F01_bin.3]
MSRFNKILNSKIIKFGLPLLAGYLLISEGVLWREKLLSNTQSLADSSGQEAASQPISTIKTEAVSAEEPAALPLESLSRVGALSQVENVPEGVFEYGGSTTWAP